MQMELPGMERGVQERLPNRHSLSLYTAQIGGASKTHLRASADENGKLAEIFINQNKAGTVVNGLLDVLARVSSKALQYGMPPEELYDSFIGMKFEPSGLVIGDPDIPTADSILDWVGRRLKEDYS